MVAIETGFWREYSKPGPHGWTLTLETTHANFLLTGLAFLVTLAVTSLWNIVGLFYTLSCVFTQNQISKAYRHSYPPTSCLPPELTWPVFDSLEAPKIFWTWDHKKTEVPQHYRWTRLLVTAISGVSLMVCGAIAAVVAPFVANEADEFTIARVKPDNCGILGPVEDIDTEAMGFGELLSMGPFWRDAEMDTTYFARGYVDNFYASSTSPTSSSIFVQETLPYRTSAHASCPLPAPERCGFDLDGYQAIFKMETEPLDSHEHLGINALRHERAGLWLGATSIQLNSIPFFDPAHP